MGAEGLLLLYLDTNKQRSKQHLFCVFVLREGWRGECCSSNIVTSCKVSVGGVFKTKEERQRGGGRGGTVELKKYMKKQFRFSSISI